MTKIWKLLRCLRDVPKERKGFILFPNAGRAWVRPLRLDIQKWKKHSQRGRERIMIKKIYKILAGVPATVVSAVFLLLHFIVPLLGVRGIPDPAWVAVIVSGLPIVYQAIERVLSGKGIGRISSDMLITIAMTAAILIGDLFAAGEVAVIMAIGSILEEWTVNRARKGVTKLLGLAPTMGRRIRGDKEEMIPAEEIEKGDILRILPGEAVPVDGRILHGETSIDQSVMTGESLPVEKSIGDDVFCGTINRFGAIDIEAVGVGEDSSLQKMIRLVQEADQKKAPTARIVDRYASWMVPASMCIAIIAFLFTGELVRAVTVLLVFCPCALTLSTPTAVMAAIGQAAKQGVIVKSGEALENMGKVDTITFDKTGTLTYGKLEVSNIVSFEEGLSEEKLLSLTASAEEKSEHPLGKAIMVCAKRRGVEIIESDEFTMSAGKGIYAEVSGRKLHCGNERYLQENGVELSEKVNRTVERYRSQGKAMILVGEGNECIGIIALSDVIRPEAKRMVARLSEMGTKAVLLTGDHHSTAAYFAECVGIEEVHADLLPEEKAGYITRMTESGRAVCMIGDGVNDALALKTADVGVAMGSMGSDIAIEAADIALMSDDISKLPYLKWLSLATVSTIHKSITASMVINMIALILSVLGIIGPTLGALIHNVGSVLVVMFAGMLYDRKYKEDKKSAAEQVPVSQTP